MTIHRVDSGRTQEKEKIEDAPIQQFDSITNIKEDLELGDGKTQEKQIRDQDEGVTRTLQFFLFIACWGSTMMGMELGLTGGASLYVIPNLHISSDHRSWISSGATWGSTVLLISSITYVVGVIIATSTQTWGQLLAGRVIMGLGIGTEAMTIPIYISDVVPKSHLEIYIGFWICWPAVQFIGLFFLPESPRYLMLKGKPEEARKCWKRFQRETPSSEEDYHDMCRKLELELSNRISLVQAVKEIVTVPRIRATFIVGGVLSLSQQWNGATSVGYYMAILLSSLGLTDKTSDDVQIPIGFWSFCWTLPAYYWLDRYGRRKMLLISFPIFMIGELTAGSSRYVDNVHNRDAGFLIGMLIFYFGFQIGILPVTWVLNGEIYELYVRNYGMAWGAFLLLGSAAATTTSFSRQVSAFTLQGTFYFYVGISLLFLIFHFLFLPETKGLLLEDVRELFDDGMLRLATKNLTTLRNSLPHKLFTRQKNNGI
eukprot:jgi/Galph1/3035/GphlegSOOS_G1699.1